MIRNIGSLKYEIDIHVARAGRRYEVFHGQKPDAEERAHEIKQALLRQRGGAGQLRTMADVFAYYEDNHLRDRRTWPECAEYPRRLSRLMGRISVKAVTLEWFGRFLRTDFDGRSGATRNRALAYTRAALSFAVANERLDRNPLAGAGKVLRKPEYIRSRILSPAEWLALQAVLTPEYIPIITFSYRVPTRRGEVQALRTEWVDTLLGKIWLPGQVTKTGEPRWLPIPGELREYFEALKTPLVFTRVGQPFTDWTLRTDWERPSGQDTAKRVPGPLGRLFQAAGIADFHFHDFRHCAATNLYQLTHDLKLVMDVGGWRSDACLGYLTTDDARIRELYGYQSPGLQKVSNSKLSQTNYNEITKKFGEED